MTLIGNLNSALDRVSQNKNGHRGLRVLAMSATAVGGAIATFAAGGSQASATCNVCCTDYLGYNCNRDCSRIAATGWACTNSCGVVCTCPDCWLPSGYFAQHCDNGCGTGPYSPSP